MNYAKLLGRIKEFGYTQKSFAERIGANESHFCRKLQSEYPFTQREIQRICNVLNIQPIEIGDYFFHQ